MLLTTSQEEGGRVITDDGMNPDPSQPGYFLNVTHLTEVELFTPMFTETQSSPSITEDGRSMVSWSKSTLENRQSPLQQQWPSVEDMTSDIPYFQHPNSLPSSLDISSGMMKQQYPNPTSLENVIQEHWHGVSTHQDGLFQVPPRQSLPSLMPVNPAPCLSSDSRLRMVDHPLYKASEWQTVSQLPGNEQFGTSSIGGYLGLLAPTQDGIGYISQQPVSSPQQSQNISSDNMLVFSAQPVSVIQLPPPQGTPSWSIYKDPFQPGGLATLSAFGLSAPPGAFNHRLRHPALKPRLLGTTSLAHQPRKSLLSTPPLPESSKQNKASFSGLRVSHSASVSPHSSLSCRKCDCPDLGDVDRQTSKHHCTSSYHFHTPSSSSCPPASLPSFSTAIQPEPCSPRSDHITRDKETHRMTDICDNVSRENQSTVDGVQNGPPLITQGEGKEKGKQVDNRGRKGLYEEPPLSPNEERSFCAWIHRKEDEGYLGTIEDLLQGLKKVYYNKHGHCEEITFAFLDDFLQRHSHIVPLLDWKNNPLVLRYKVNRVCDTCFGFD